MNEDLNVSPPNRSSDYTIYREQETLIGEWINGKPLYRKFLIDDTARDGSTIITFNITDLNAENVHVNYNNSFYVNNNINTCSIGANCGINMSGRNCEVATYTSYTECTNSTVRVLIGNTVKTQKTIVCIEYTKTTD